MPSRAAEKSRGRARQEPDPEYEGDKLDIKGQGRDTERRLQTRIEAQYESKAPGDRRHHKIRQDEKDELRL
jgi:hypothetical protein